ncbi:hypothetical protein JHK82_031893 [Glycine max]|nr:hypothetical protein JHK85_032556 [Glycine max]KAG5125156.1 hypothetical protein JHK82_031893 [Glycine max]
MEFSVGNFVNNFGRKIEQVTPVDNFLRNFLQTPYPNGHRGETTYVEAHNKPQKMSRRSSRTVYVGNLPGDIREREVEDLFLKVL